MSDPQLPDALVALVGEWYGDGVGSAPGHEEGFRFAAELTVEHVRPGVLSWTSVSRAPEELSGCGSAGALPQPDNSRGALTESGFWRWDPATGRVEAVLARAAGSVVVLIGELRDDPQGGEGRHVEFASEVLAHTATGEPATGERRLYARRGDVLLFAIDRKQRDGDLVPRASGALHPRAGTTLPGPDAVTGVPSEGPPSGRDGG